MTQQPSLPQPIPSPSTKAPQGVKQVQGAPAAVPGTSPLFDITVTVPETSKKVAAGDDLLMTIKLINIGSEGRVDVYLDYIINYTDGKTLLKSQETVAIETQASFVRTFRIPKDAKPGTYHLNTKITYANGKTAASEDSFEVIVKRTAFDLKIAYYALAMIVFISAIFLLMRGLKPKFKGMALRMKVHDIVKRKEDGPKRP